MAVYIPDSLPAESQQSQKYADYTFEPTQLSQPHFSQTQNTQNTQNGANSQVEPRRKYWAIFLPVDNASHSLLKIPWSKSSLQIGRGPHGISGNDLVLEEKRISNRHCKITLGIGSGTSSEQRETVQKWKEGDEEPEVWIEDMKSSNGTFINGKRIKTRYLLQHGDEVSLGHESSLDNHDVRYVFRSVGAKGGRVGRNGSKDAKIVGQVYEKYQFLQRLGKGSFATVHRAVDIETGDMRAIKQITKHRFEQAPKTLALFQREIAICTALQHEHICRLIEAFEDPQHINLVLEYVDGGDMLDYIMHYPGENGGGLPESLTAELTLQICQAMAYTHSQGVTHRDLKPENILITAESPGNPPIVKIADFGLAKMVVDAQTMLVSMVGTPQYLAPEVVMQTSQNPGYENVVDSWSVGIIVYSMLTKALPFDEDENLPVDKRIKARFTQPFDRQMLYELNVSAEGVSFIERLLEKNPADRMTMAEALEHPWLAGPSSQQHPSSSRTVLGGDSQWEINSFDGNDDAPKEGFSSDSFDMQWTRPGTVSGTNMESGLAGESEDFSQPMENLHLQTPAHRARFRSSLQFIDSPHGGSNNTEAPEAANGADSPLLNGNGDVNMDSHHSSALPLYTPPPSATELTSLKRKKGEEKDPNIIDAFSSGSLSPPPSSVPKEPVVPAPAPAPAAPTRVSTRKSKTKVETPTNTSPRRSTRPRKSIRLS